MLSAGVSGSWNSSGGGHGERCSSVHAARSEGKRVAVQPIPSQRRWFSNIEKVNFTPGEEVAGVIVVVEARGGSAGGMGEGDNVSPVMRWEKARSVVERHRIVRLTFAGRECQDSKRVPERKMMRRGVMMWNGHIESASQNGVSSRMRMKRVVSAGPVVAVVAFFSEDRMFSNVTQGERKTSTRWLSRFMVARMSSSVVPSSRL